MKLKCIPQDFRVEEITEFAPDGTGPFALYRLTKRGLGTPEAVEAVARRWKLARHQIAHGGLKDRHAVTMQHVSIHRGPKRSLRQTSLQLEYLGQSARPFASGDIVANRFHIVLRSMTRAELVSAERAIQEVARYGIPNYFDDQRFGSLGETSEFVARHWIAGDHERALWLALADSNPLDRPRDRQEKKSLRDHWGNWTRCPSPLRSPRSDVVQYLLNRPGDYRGAIARIPASLRSLYVAAFQSFLWNRLLADLLMRDCSPDQLALVRLRMGEVPFYLRLADQTRAQLQKTELPLPSARMHLEAGPIRELVEKSLGSLGLTLRELRIKYPRDSFFSKGWRPAIVMPAGVSAAEEGADELYRGSQKLSLCFDLPRGSYATILIKRLTQATAVPAGPAEFDDL